MPTAAVLVAGCGSAEGQSGSGTPSTTTGSTSPPTTNPAPTTTVPATTTQPRPIPTVPLPTDDEADAITQTIEDTWETVAATPPPATMVPGPPYVASTIAGDDPVRGHLMVREPIVKHQITMGPDRAYETSAYNCTHSRSPTGEIVTRLWSIKLRGEGDAWVVDQMHAASEWDGETTCTDF